MVLDATAEIDFENGSDYEVYLYQICATPSSIQITPFISHRHVQAKINSSYSTGKGRISSILIPLVSGMAYEGSYLLIVIRKGWKSDVIFLLKVTYRNRLKSLQTNNK